MAEAPKRIVAGTHSVLGINVWRGPERRQDLLEGGTEYVRADIHEATLHRQAAAARTLQASTLETVRHLQEKDRSEHTAAATLESEREANALLTAEIERLRTLNSEMREALEVPDTKGPYEARFVDGGIPSDCCEYGVISLSEGREVCRVWREQDARAIAAALSALTAGGDDG